eukprot:2823734-Rhodomonas_salina.1
MSHLRLTDEHGGHRVPLRRVGNKWLIAIVDQTLEVFEQTFQPKPLTPRRPDNDELLLKYHQLLGHVNIKDVVLLSRIDPDMPVLYMPKGKVQRFSCWDCNQTKITGGPGKKKAHRRAGTPLQRVFLNIAGKVSTPAISCYKYFMVLVDDAMRSIFVYLLKNKFNAVTAFKEFCATYCKPGTLKSDNAPELKEGDFLQFTLGEEIY